MQATEEEKAKQKFIELNAFIKINNLATSGGRAKLLIRSGEISVNSIKETRNKRKLHPGDVVTYMGKNYAVKAEVCKMG